MHGWEERKSPQAWAVDQRDSLHIHALMALPMSLAWSGLIGWAACGRARHSSDALLQSLEQCGVDNVLAQVIVNTALGR